MVPAPAFAVQLPDTQYAEVPQSASVVHAAAHAPAVHTVGEQLCIPPEAHTPLPSHWLALVRTLPTHTGGAQIVPLGYRAQAPAPLQEPVVPQLVEGWAAHSASGSVPAAMGPHVPSVPAPFLAALHAWQSPVQALEQHTPSTQRALAHWSAAVQVAPTAPVGTQALPLQ